MTFGRSPPGRRTPTHRPTERRPASRLFNTTRRPVAGRLWSHPRWMAGWPRKTRACAQLTARFFVAGTQMVLKNESRVGSERYNHVSSEHGSDPIEHTAHSTRNRGYPLGSSAALTQLSAVVCLCEHCRLSTDHRTLCTRHTQIFRSEVLLLVTRWVQWAVQHPHLGDRISGHCRPRRVITVCAPSCSLLLPSRAIGRPRSPALPAGPR